MVMKQDVTLMVLNHGDKHPASLERKSALQSCGVEGRATKRMDCALAQRTTRNKKSIQTKSQHLSGCENGKEHVMKCSSAPVRAPVQKRAYAQMSKGWGQVGAGAVMWCTG